MVNGMQTLSSSSSAFSIHLLSFFSLPSAMSSLQPQVRLGQWVGKSCCQGQDLGLC